jgi:hypothetical protein
MSDRLSELVRQRALVLEHLAWLDREISQANAASPTVPDPQSIPPAATLSSTTQVPAAAPGVNAPSASTTPPSAASVSARSDARAPIGSHGLEKAAFQGGTAPGGISEKMLEQYRVSPKAVHQDVRKGCLLYFVGAFVLLGIVVAILYFSISSR